jgi:dienelactone hydrolase
VTKRCSNNSNSFDSDAKTINYASAVARVQPVGVFVASYLDFLHENDLIDYSRVSLLGFSLGGGFL